MRINQFALKNYKSCLITKIELLANPTCLIGFNGTGKSNILNGLLIFRKCILSTNYSLHRTSPKKSATSKVIADIQVDNKIVQIKCEFAYEADEKNIDTFSNIEISINLKGLHKSTSWVEIPLYYFDYMKDIGPSELYDLRYGRIINSKYYTFFQDKNREIISKVVEFITSISYYSASQFSDPYKCPVSFELEDMKTSKYRRQSYANHQKFIEDLFITFQSNRTLFTKYMSLVNERSIGLIQGIKFTQMALPSKSYEVKSGGKIRLIDKSRRLIIPSVIIDKSQLSFNQLSEGTFKTLALIFYIITDKSPILLIEEPEVCVHHGLLNSILELIISESTRKQIVISTHSDFVLDKLKPENIVLVTKPREKGTTAKPLKKSMSKNDFLALKQYLLSTGNLGEYWKEGGFLDGK